MTGITGRNEPRTRQGARLIRRGTLVARPPGEVPEGLALPLPLPLLISRAPDGPYGRVPKGPLLIEQRMNA
jgi:hypothetical protein